MKRLTIATLLLFACGPDQDRREPASASGVHKAKAKISVGSDGFTVEQRNVKKRLEKDNTAGSIKHLYIVSSFSGQVILYSTVDGKVTSGGKRLTPKTVHASRRAQYSDAAHYGIPVNIGGRELYTAEVLQDDGTYGSSNEYLYWFDANGIYHQHFPSGGTFLQISDEPQSFGSVTMQMEDTADVATDSNFDNEE